MHFAYTALCDELLNRVAADVATGQHRESIARARVERPQGRCPGKGSGVVPRREHIINAKPQQDLQRLHRIGCGIKRPVKGDLHGAGQRHQLRKLRYMDGMVVLQWTDHHAVHAQ